MNHVAYITALYGITSSSFSSFVIQYVSVFVIAMPTTEESVEIPPCPVVAAAARLNMVSTAFPYQCPRPLSFVLLAPIGVMFLSASLG
jgi:hypothetical protein